MCHYGPFFHFETNLFSPVYPAAQRISVVLPFRRNTKADTGTENAGFGILKKVTRLGQMGGIGWELNSMGGIKFKQYGRKKLH